MGSVCLFLAEGNATRLMQVLGAVSLRWLYCGRWACWTPESVQQRAQQLEGLSDGVGREREHVCATFWGWFRLKICEQRL